jgi:hypothetical protein
MNRNDYIRETGSRVNVSTRASDLRTVYIVMWRGRAVDGKEFGTEAEAWVYLDRCDAAGRIID